RLRDKSGACRHEVERGGCHSSLRDSQYSTERPALPLSCRALGERIPCLAQDLREAVGAAYVRMHLLHEALPGCAYVGSARPFCEAEDGQGFLAVHLAAGARGLLALVTPLPSSGKVRVFVPGQRRLPIELSIAGHKRGEGFGDAPVID